jgi:KDO2-lipid IV(A) lauroyltransferase
MFVLYGLSDIMAIILQYIVKYRKPIVIANLHKAFPMQDKRIVRRWVRRYYRHLADLLIEGIKMLSISKKKVLQHYHCTNANILQSFYERGQSVILVSSHYNNWEYMVLSLALQSPYHGIGVGKPLSNKWFDRILNDYRQRYGTEVVFSSHIRETFENYHHEKRLSAYMMLFDQSPANAHKSYWTQFLNQETGFIFGPEYFAVKYEYPVLYYTVRKPRRGRYEIDIEVITERPSSESHGAITKRCIQRLEATIKRDPPYWLWSHRRWKHQRPADMPLN